MPSNKLDGIPGVINLSDDILVFGRTRAAHDQALRATFQRLKEKNLTLNKDKCSYAQTTLDFFGYTFSDGGFSPDPKKVQALHDAAAPTNVSEVRSLLGMANYSARFIKDFATITQPLRELTKKTVRWTWAEEHQSDHKPLEWIFNNPKSKPPARIERWSLRLQPYNYTVRYKSGPSESDYLNLFFLASLRQMQSYDEPMQWQRTG
ncbi:hypothetical protein AAFF_G00153040 [Aldrovandia affinis]|uniref:ribonuclease H n=1 Tax=Aldrovandia affinis TaxID=143900 RepID=A0AAD7RNM2_9TELE|nr:hypothetical protein AAFF_G00153040 [Aldrovandia affinis]